MLKIFVFGISVLFYFFFIIPSSVSAEEFSQYNWFNQSLIDFKINLINIFSNGTEKGGAAGTSISIINSSTSTIVPNTPTPGSSTLTTMKGVQTNLGGITVSKSVEVVNLLGECLDERMGKVVQDSIKNSVKNITD